ncbi:MAG: hypothetical protein ACSHYF_14625 [Verrucomicrobiaceae bacterium]
MKSISLFAFAAFLLGSLVSCESTNSHKSGGGSFDDSHLGPKLDANAHLDDPATPGSNSFEEWRDKD